MAALTESELPQAGRALRWRLASDQVLTRAAASGAEGAFDEIFARYQPALVRHCRAVLLDSDEAQDAAQNALTSALRALRRGTSEPVSLKAWLYRIAHNEAIALARRRADQQARRAPGDGSEAELIAVAGPGDDDTRERLRDLVVDLRELPDRQRSALLLRELSGLDYTEVAEVLGTSAGAARQTVFEARAALMDIGAGRSDACDGIRRVLSDGDGRVVRGRRVRSHLRGCGTCSAFAAQIGTRERDLALVFPLAPMLAVLGGGAGAGAASLAGAGAVAGGGWSLGLGTSVAVKCATFCAAAAVLGTVAIGGDPATRLHHSSSGEAVQIAAAPAHGTPHAAIVLPQSHTIARNQTRRSTTRSAPARHAASSAAVVKAPAHTVRAYLPAVAAVPSHSESSAGDAPSAPAQASVPAAAPAANKHFAAAPIPAIAQQAVAAAQQMAAGAMQQAMTYAQNQMQNSLALAQQMMARAMTGFFQHGTTSANAPASPSTP